jgi:CO dehydrogenase maturation factor
LLGELEEKSGRVVVADLEAGVGTVSRLQATDIDVLVLVVEPYAKSLEVAKRALKIAREVGVPEVVLVASRVVDGDDVAEVRTALPALTLFTVPDDPEVLEADRAGLAPIDHAPESPAVAAIRDIARELVPASAR